VRAPDDRQQRGRERLRDEEIAEAIVGELRHHDPAIDRSRAVDHIKSRIEELRGFDRKAATEPRPSAAKRTVAQIADHAEALATCIEKLSPNWRLVLSWMFYERGDNGSLALSAGSHLAAGSRMNDWISDLKKISHDLGLMRNSPHDFFTGPKVKCAFEAREIILALSPTMKLTKGETFYLITSWLWEAISGEQEKSLKRACDRVLSLFAAMERAALSVSDAGD
jgi:uncharacterized protein YndB with AHSA1/START domain